MQAPNPYVIWSSDPTKDDALTEAGKHAVGEARAMHGDEQVAAAGEQQAKAAAKDEEDGDAEDEENPPRA